MRFLRDFALLFLALAVAYGGGYYTGRHPKSVRELMSSESVVIATTEERIFTQEVQDYIEERWGHSISVLVIADTEISSRLLDTDLILAPRNVLKTFEKQLKPRPVDLSVSEIETDFLINGDTTLPLLWKLVPIDDKRTRLIKLSLAWTPKSADLKDLIRWLLSRQAQVLMTKETGYSPVHKELLQETQGLKGLRAIPLQNLNYE